jgi:hypothetical protein
VPVELESSSSSICSPAVLHPAPGVVTDLDQVADELVRLRAIEADLDVDDPRGDTYAHVIDLLAWQLRRAARDAGEISDLDEDYVRVAADELVRYSAPWAGPVVDAWRRTLTPIAGPGLDQLRRLRRVHRLLRDDGLGVDGIREAYRDTATSWSSSSPMVSCGATPSGLSRSPRSTPGPTRPCWPPTPPMAAPSPCSP